MFWRCFWLFLLLNVKQITNKFYTNLVFLFAFLRLMWSLCLQTCWPHHPDGDSHEKNTANQGEMKLKRGDFTSIYNMFILAREFSLSPEISLNETSYVKLLEKLWEFFSRNIVARYHRKSLSTSFDIFFSNHKIKLKQRISQYTEV